MKTAQIMIRDLNGVPIRQNHKTGMFNANDLVDAYNKKNPNEEKRLDNYLKSKSALEYIEYLFELESKSLKMSDLKFNPIRPKNVIVTKRGRVNGGTWMNPYLFLDCAMWLDVEFKHWAMGCVHDKLIEVRDQAGDSFKEVNEALAEVYGPQRPIVYIREARMINGLVFGGKSNQRNQATIDELDLLTRLQKADIKLIQEGQEHHVRERSLKLYKNLLQ